MRSLGRVLFQERCIECLHYCTHNTDRSPLEVVPVPMIFMKNPHMRLRRKKLGPTANLREGRKKRALARATEAEEGEEEEVPPLVLKRKKVTTTRKRKQAVPGFTSAPKKAKVCFTRSQYFFFLLLIY